MYNLALAASPKNDPARSNLKRLTVLAFLLSFGVAWGQQTPPVPTPGTASQQQAPAPAGSPKKVTVFIEGDTSMIPKVIKLAREIGPSRNLDFTFIRDKDQPFDIRFVLSAEGSSTWSYAHSNAVIMDSKSNVLFTITRSDRLTGKGAASAVTKEFVKNLARYYGLHK